MRTQRSSEHDDGFTLVELLVVMVILGVLAAIALPTFLRQKDKSYRATLMSDLRAAAATQEAWAADHSGTYTSDVGELGREGFRSSEGVVVQVERAGVDGFCLSAEHSAGQRLYYSTADGAPTESGCV